MSSRPVTVAAVHGGRTIGTVRFGNNHCISVHAAACVLCGASVYESTTSSVESAVGWLTDHWASEHDCEIR
jgi:hypothetical protein